MPHHRALRMEPPPLSPTSTATPSSHLSPLSPSLTDSEPSCSSSSLSSLSSSSFSSSSSSSPSSCSPTSSDLPPAKSTRQSVFVHRRTSHPPPFSPRSPSTASPATHGGAARMVSLPAASLTGAVVLPASPSCQRQESGVSGLLSRFDSLSSRLSAASPLPPQSPSPPALLHSVTRSRTGRTATTLGTPRSTGTDGSRRTRSLTTSYGAPTSRASPPSFSMRGTLPLSPSFPLYARSQSLSSLPGGVRGSALVSSFRSIAHDLNASPSTSPLFHMSPCASPTSGISPFPGLSPSFSKAKSAFPSSSPILLSLPQPDFDNPPWPLAATPDPSCSPSPSPAPIDPTPSPSASPHPWYTQRPKLPLSGKTSDGVAMISCATVASLLRGDEWAAEFDSVLVLDCRFAYEYSGGHIRGAVNFTSLQQLTEALLPADVTAVTETLSSLSSLSSSSSSSPESSTPSPPPSPSRRCLVFHCEYSQSRAPQYFSALRRLDTALHPFPALSPSFPDMYVMEGGYRKWVTDFPELCEPHGGYVEMNAKQWREECGRGLKARKAEKRGELDRKRKRQQRGSELDEPDGLRRITRSSTAAAATTGGGELSSPPVFRRTSSCFSLSSAFSPIPLSLVDEDARDGPDGEAGDREERRAKREKRAAVGEGSNLTLYAP